MYAVGGAEGLEGEDEGEKGMADGGVASAIAQKGQEGDIEGWDGKRRLNGLREQYVVERRSRVGIYLRGEVGESLKDY